MVFTKFRAFLNCRKDAVASSNKVTISSAGAYNIKGNLADALHEEIEVEINKGTIYIEKAYDVLWIQKLQLI